MLPYMSKTSLQQVAIDVFQGYTVHVGASFGEGPLAGLGVEANLASEEGKKRPTTGGTAYWLIASGKANIPILPLEVYGGFTHTWFHEWQIGPLPSRFNIFSVLLWGQQHLTFDE